MNNQEIKKLEEKYNVIYISFSESFLKSMEEKYLKKSIQTVSEKKKSVIPDNVVTPDRKYVKSLIDALSGITELGDFELNNYRKRLQNLLDNGDFDDYEDIMDNVHGLIEKYIYGSDTKVSASGWAELENYIINAGYIPLDIKTGDDVTPFRKYFRKPIPASGGTPNTIKNIQLKPFTLKYYDGEEVKADLKLCGKCTYYK